MRLRLQGILVASAMWILAGCATYSDAVVEAQVDVQAGRPGDALVHFDERLETDSPRDLPADLDDEKVLLLLERATLLQATGQYELAARDMMIADQRLEWLDIDAYDRVDLARWLYSDDARKYRAPAYERLLLNTLNMLNFLAMRDYEGARVEARRFALIEEFFIEEESDVINRDVRALGHYLSAVAFEYGGRWDAAQERYEEAWRLGMRSASQRQRLIGLYRLTGANARGHDDDASGIVDLRIEAQLKGALRLAEYRRRFLTGDTLIVAQAGFAPHKRPERVPIGRAWVWAGAAKSQWALSSSERARGQEMMASGLLKWVNLPVLTDHGFNVDPGVAVSVDGESVRVDSYTDVASQVVEAWQDVLGPIVASAITRAITRAVAGSATRVATREAGENTGGSSGAAIQAIGLLASLALEGGMAVADTPDTRSWTMLPGTIRVIRASLEPGEHTITVRVGSREDERRVGVSENGLNLFNYSKLR